MCKIKSAYVKVRNVPFNLWTTLQFLGVFKVCARVWRCVKKAGEGGKKKERRT